MKVTKVNTQSITDFKRRTAHCYIFPQGEGIMENLMNRRSRPHLEWKKLMPEILKKAGLSTEEIKEIKPSWSQKCGCGCGCSPGFKLNGYNKMVDIFVDVDVSK